MDLLSILIVILIIVLIIDAILTNNNEHFWEPSCTGSKAGNCYHLSERNCLKYANCGLCLQDGKTECVPGDVNGPYFKEDCAYWKKTDDYDKYLFEGQEVRISPPTTAYYPEYEQRWVSNGVRAML